MTDRRLATLFLVGLALRLPGLLFNGMGDIYRMLLEWGLLRRARDLIAVVTELPAYSSPDWPLRVQRWVSDTMGLVPGETMVSRLSIVVFGLACLMVRRLFREPQEGAGVE